MKRFTAAALAATTAISLAAAPAQAAEGLKDLAIDHDSSSQVTDEELGIYAVAAIVAEAVKEGEGFSAPFMGSSEAGLFKTDSEAEIANQSAVMTSSFQNDANQGYKLGTTYDILVGTGIALAVLAAVGGAAAAGVIPGVALPALPF